MSLLARRRLWRIARRLLVLEQDHAAGDRREEQDSRTDDAHGSPSPATADGILALGELGRFPVEVVDTKRSHRPQGFREPLAELARAGGTRLGFEGERALEQRVDGLQVAAHARGEV